MRVPDLKSLLAPPQRRNSPAPAAAEPENTPVSSAEIGTAGLESGRSSAAAPAAVGAGPVPRIDRRPAHQEVKTSAQPPARLYKRTRALSLPQSVHQALVAEAARRGISLTALMLIAIDARHAELGPLLHPADEAGGNLFTIPQAMRGQEESTATTIRLTEQQLLVIRDLIASYGTTRSALFTAAARSYLDLV